MIRHVSRGDHAVKLVIGVGDGDAALINRPNLAIEVVKASGAYPRKCILGVFWAL